MNKEDRMHKLSQGTPTAVWTYNRIQVLEEWIKHFGEARNICTEAILGKTGNYCQCKHKEELK